MTQTDVEYVFVDTRVQRLLKRHALAAGEDPGWLDSVFQTGSIHPSPIIRHARGHATHMHIRFHNPRAEALGYAVHDLLVARGLVAGKRRYARYRIEPGDGWNQIANRFGIAPVALRKMNRSTGSQLLAGRTLTIPLRRVGRCREPQVPARRLPPDYSSSSGRALAAEHR